MIVKLENTTASVIDKKLSELRESEGLITLSRVATLVIITSQDSLDDPIQAAIRASQEHPARIIVIIADPSSERDLLDAEIRVGTEAGAGEVIILKASGHVTTGLDTLITPLLLPDAPIVTWWPNEAPASPAQDSLGAIATRRITDVLNCASPKQTLQRLSRGYTPGDSDLSWSRITNWRGLVATAYEQPPIQTPKKVTIEGLEDNPSVILMKSWLESNLPGVEIIVKHLEADHGLMTVILHRSDGDIRLHRESTETIVLSTPPDSKEQRITMPKRTMYDLLSEELRRLDPDEIYGEVLTSAFEQANEPSEFAAGKPEPEVKIVEDLDDLADEVARFSIDQIAKAIEARAVAHVVLTGGTAGTTAAKRFARLLADSNLDSSKVHIWWGDERFVPSKSDERNDRPVISKLTTGAGIPVYNVHALPAADAGMSLEEAAAWYGQQLSLHGGDNAFNMSGQAFFDVLMLGVGPDSHVASLFPEHPDAKGTSAYAVAVKDSPKPPSERISLSWAVLNSARHVTFLVAGKDKADAVQQSLQEINAKSHPASAVRGLVSTTWFIDELAGAKLGS